MCALVTGVQTCALPIAPPGQYPWADFFNKRRIVVGDQVGRPTAYVQHGEGLGAAFAPVGRGELGGVELTANEGIGQLLPVGRLDDVALRRWMEAKALVPRYRCS